MQPTPIVRPTWLALHKKTLLGLLTMSAIGAVGFRYLDRKPPAPAATIVTPIPTVITVPITTPAPVVNVTVPQPEPPPAPYVPPPRLLTPVLAAECVLPLPPDAEPSQAACPDGMGLPAISPDGSTLAIRASREDAALDSTVWEMRFLDVATSKVVRTRLLFDTTELDGFGQATPKLTAKVRKTVAALQKELVGYRSLVPLERRDTPTEHGPYVDASEDARGILRVVDADANAVLVQERFLSRDQFGDGCGVGADWDARTRVILAVAVSNACKCDTCSAHHDYYVRIAPTP